MVSFTTFPSKGYCNEWSYVFSNEYLTWYYNSSSVKIDKNEKTIKVWVKQVFTEKGKKDYLNEVISIDNQKYTDFKYSLLLYLINYRDWEYCTTNITDYSNSDNVLNSIKPPPKWKDILPDSTFEFFTNQLLKIITLRGNL